MYKVLQSKVYLIRMKMKGFEIYWKICRTYMVSQPSMVEVIMLGKQSLINFFERKYENLSSTFFYRYVIIDVGVYII